MGWKIVDLPNEAEGATAPCSYEIERDGERRTIVVENGVSAVADAADVCDSCRRANGRRVSTSRSATERRCSVELGLKLQGEGQVEGGWVDRVVGLEGVRVEYAMVETPDGHGRLELVKFHSPSVRGGDGHAPANILGIRHVAFAVDDQLRPLSLDTATSSSTVDRP